MMHTHRTHNIDIGCLELISLIKEDDRLVEIRFLLKDNNMISITGQLNIELFCDNIPEADSPIRYLGSP